MMTKRANPRRSTTDSHGPVRLLIASPTQGHYGGIEAFVLALAESAATWPEFDVHVCFKVVGRRAVADDLRSFATALSCSVSFTRSGSPELLRHVHWADIVHGQNVSPDIVFPAWVAGKKLVLTVHNWRREGPGVHALLWRVGVRLAQRRWYNSHFVWNTWEPGRKSRGSDCVPTVCRLPSFVADPETQERRRGFLFVGRWIANKGIEELIRAYAQAQLDPVAWPLALLGDGPLRPAVFRLVTELNLRGVDMPGFVDDATKTRRINAAKWLVAPAKTREDLGLTPIEARSAGVPVIATRDGGLPEAAGDAALLTEPGDIEGLAGCLHRAATMSHHEYRQRAERGRQTLSHFLRPITFYRDAYRQLVGCPPLAVTVA